MGRKIKSMMAIPEQYRKQIEKRANEIAQEIINEELKQMRHEVSMRCICTTLLTLDDCFRDRFGDTEEEIEKNYKRFCQCFSGMISDYNRDCFVWDKSKDPHEMSKRLIAECKERRFEVEFE